MWVRRDVWIRHKQALDHRLEEIATLQKRVQALEDSVNGVSAFEQAERCLADRRFYSGPVLGLAETMQALLLKLDLNPVFTNGVQFRDRSACLGSVPGKKAPKRGKS